MIFLFYFCKILSFCLLSQNSDHITHHHEKRVKKARLVKIKKMKPIKKVLLAWLLIAWNLHCQEGCKLLGILPRLMISCVRCYSESTKKLLVERLIYSFQILVMLEFYLSCCLLGNVLIYVLQFVKFGLLVLENYSIV